MSAPTHAHADICHLRGQVDAYMIPSIQNSYKFCTIT